jgi:hypothetical protein
MTGEGVGKLRRLVLASCTALMVARWCVDLNSWTSAETLRVCT